MAGRDVKVSWLLFRAELVPHWPKGHATAIQIEIFREILRAEEARQDDRCLRVAETLVVYNDSSTAFKRSRPLFKIEICLFFA
jgi:hypothetical protein